MSEQYTPTTDDVADAWASRYDGEHTSASGDERRGYEAEFYRWLTEHDRQTRAEALREAHADIQAYMDTGAPFGHRPVEEFLLRRADRIEKEVSDDE